jgi:hypothetical protein
MVKQNLLHAQLKRKFLNLVSFSAADEQRSIWGAPLARDPSYWVKAGGLGQQAKLFEFAVKVGKSEINTHQQRGDALDIKRRQVRHPQRL